MEEQVIIDDPESIVPPIVSHASKETCTAVLGRNLRTLSVPTKTRTSSIVVAPSVHDTEDTESSEPSFRSDTHSEVQDDDDERNHVAVSTRTKTTKTKSSSFRNVTDGHFQWWGHGRVWTILGIVFAVTGCSLAFLARQNVEFVVLNEPIPMPPVYQGMKFLGLLWLNICWNDTTATATGSFKCERIELHSDDVDDAAFELARVLVSLSALLGTLLTVCLLTTIYWESINLKPVGLGFLVVYFSQALVMLVFDAGICHQHKCRPGRGCVQCILASVCWMGVCLVTAKMDGHKMRLRRRRHRRRKRQAAKAAAAAAATAILQQVLVGEDEEEEEKELSLSLPEAREEVP